jgi:hypothetical protein
MIVPFENLDLFILAALGLIPGPGEKAPFCVDSIEVSGTAIPLEDGVELVLQTIFPPEIVSVLRDLYGFNEKGEKLSYYGVHLKLGGGSSIPHTYESRAFRMIQSNPVRCGFLAEFLKNPPTVKVPYEDISLERILDLIALYDAICSIAKREEYNSALFGRAVAFLSNAGLEAEGVIRVSTGILKIEGIGPQLLPMVQRIVAVYQSA